MSRVHLDVAILERLPHTETRGQGSRIVRPPAILEENTYRLDYNPDAGKSPWAFVARHDQDALIHLAERHRISLPTSSIAFLIGWATANCWRLVRLCDGRQVYPAFN